MSHPMHWQDVHENRAVDSTSWFQHRAEPSLSLIQHYCAVPDAAIVDVGAGASTLVDGLIAAGYRDLTVMDIAPAALAATRQRLGQHMSAAASTVDWQIGDVTSHDWPPHRFALWHDRAVFHFLVEATDRHAYVERMHEALVPGGHIIMATFANDGPERCSGLAVRRYDQQTLAAELGSRFIPVAAQRESHVTPAGRTQAFVYAVFRKGG